MLKAYKRCLDDKEKEILCNIKYKGRIFALLILKQENKLKGYISSEELANLFSMRIKDKKNIIKKVRIEMQKLYPIIDYGLEKKSDKSTEREFFYTGFKVNIEEPTSGYVQLPCDLLKIIGMTPDLLVVFTVLNYYKHKYDNLNIRPPHKYMATIAGCSERKMYTLLEEGKRLGLWKYTAIKQTYEPNIYNISYIKNNEEHYYFYDVIAKQEMEKLSIESYLNAEKAENA